MESENARFFLERTIYDLAGSFWERFTEELHRQYPQLPEPAPFLSIGSWVGTDRDGNPFVTPATSLHAGRGFGSAFCATTTPPAIACSAWVSVARAAIPRSPLDLRREIERDMKRFPETRAFEKQDQASELYRRKLRIMMWRLVANHAAARGRLRWAKEFIEDLRRLGEKLKAFHSPRVARLGPGRLRIAAQVFGFYGASLDFRTHSRVTRAAAGEVLQKAKLPAEPEAGAHPSIQRLLSRPPVRASFSPGTRHAWRNFARCARISCRTAKRPPTITFEHDLLRGGHLGHPAARRQTDLSNRAAAVCIPHRCHSAL